VIEMANVWKVIIGITAVGALVGVIAVGAGADDKEPSASGAERTIAALDKVPSDSDRLPDVAVAEVEDLSPDGTDVADTIKARTTPEGSFYLTPTPQGACLTMVSDGGATTRCLPATDLAQPSGRPAQSVTLTGCTAESPEAAPDCDNAVIYGVAPNGVQRVVLEGADERAGDVVNNVYVLSVPEAQAMAAVEYR
jgi:hypothetical protein